MMNDDDSPNSKKILEEEPQPKPLWIERMDACLYDEFRYRLNEIMTFTNWGEVRHGAWDDPINFFV